jgi:phosphatidate cytidylyltransferase
MTNLVIRTLTGIGIVAVLTTAILFSSVTYIVLMMLILALTMAEFYRIIRVRLNRPNVPVGILIGLVMFMISVVYSVKIAPPELIAVLIPLFIMVFVVELYRLQKNPLANVGLTFLGIIYVALPFALFNFMVFEGVSENPDIEVANTQIHYVNEFLNFFLFMKPDTHIVYNPTFLMAFFIIIWVYDSVAYLAGVKFGRHKLFHSVSPKKSWEGFIGGIIFTPLTAFIMFKIFGQISLTNWIIYSLIVVIFATFGDLVESLFKRSINIKDSGKILPGHGGLLDRFDSTLLAAPMAYLYLELIR